MFIFQLIAIVGIYLIQGTVVKMLWGWFISPFLGLPMLGIAQALGLTLTLCVLTGTISIPKNTSSGKWYEQLVLSLILNGIVLMLGWIFHLFL
jgi:hypothetical protein